MDEPSKRVGGQYSRKRALHACLVCRARKSRYDGQRPSCGFCVKTNSECTYPDIEPASLDKASVLILERIQAMESNVLKQLMDVTASGALVTSTGNLLTPAAKQRHRSWSQWPSGDIVMSWNVLREPITRCGQHRQWEMYRTELLPNPDGSSETPGPSPSVKAEFVRPDVATDPFNYDQVTLDDMPVDCGKVRVLKEASAPRAQRDMPVDSSSESANLTASLIRNYVVNFHSKPPILDLHFLKDLEDRLLKDSELQNCPVQKALPTGLHPPDMAILLLVLALGEVSARTSPEKQPLGQSHYIALALPWLGVTAVSNASPIKDLQAQLLLASYEMWILWYFCVWYTETLPIQCGGAGNMASRSSTGIIICLIYEQL